jgi:cysteinyl-tRNA synthetase
MQLGQDKMSKSLGNLITVREALSKYSADAIRLFILSSHYRSPVAYSEESLEAMERGAARLRLAAQGEEGGTAIAFDPDPYRQRFIEVMDDDFNTAKAVAILFDLDREINQRRSEGFTVEEAQKTLIELAGVLGLTLKEELARAIPSTELIELLISVRDRLRAEQNWALADDIRSRLRELGIILEDTAKGTVWRYNRR